MGYFEVSSMMAVMDCLYLFARKVVLDITNLDIDMNGLGNRKVEHYIESILHFNKLFINLWVGLHIHPKIRYARKS